MAKKPQLPNEGSDYLERRAKLIDDASKDLNGYLKAVQDIEQTERNLAHILESNLKAKQELKDIEDAILELKRRAGPIDQAALDKLNKEKVIKNILIDHSEEIYDLAVKERDIQEDALKLTKLRGAAWRSLLVKAKEFGKTILSQNGWLLEQQKAVKGTELTMGILSNQANGFRQNMYKTSLNTQKLGVGTKDLAAIQGTYSQSIGRAVMLSEEQMISMASLAKGTMLGAEGAAEFAGNMDAFGISTKDSVKYVQKIVDSAHEMGLDASTLIKTVGKNMKMAQKYNFKDGLNGLTKMAALTTKFKLEMESVASFADKLMTPEGAVEAAAKLQVLGGEWSKLGDPFELMFRSRNDLEGLTKDIIEAANGTAKFNEKTGEFSIDPMELHRLREVSNVTGMSAENLAEMAKQNAKFSKIKGQIGGVFSDEDKDYIATLSQYNSTSKQFEITYVNEAGITETKNVKDMGSLSADFLTNMRKNNESLAARAVQSQTYQDTWVNLVDTFRATILPGFEGVSKVIQDFLLGFRTWADKHQLFQGMVSLTKSIGDWVLDNPIKSGVAVAAAILGKEAMWLLRGAMLGKGFNLSARAPGTIPSTPTGRNAGGFLGNTRNTLAEKGAGTGGFGGAMARSAGGKWGMGTMKGMGAGMGLGLAGGALSLGRGMMDDPESGWGKAAGVGSMGLQGAGIGMMFGPLGAAIGGGLGLLAGTINEFVLKGEKENNKNNGNVHQDFVSRPGSNPVSFSSKDTLIGAKTGGPIDKMLNNSVGGGTANVGGVTKIEFSRPLKIEGSLELKSDGKTGKIDLDDPILMRDLSRMIQEQLSRAINGGVNPSNPITR